MYEKNLHKYFIRFCINYCESEFFPLMGGPSLSLMLDGLIQEQQENYHGALSIYQQLMASGMSHPILLYRLGIFYDLALGGLTANSEQALIFFEQAACFAPACFQLYCHYAKLRTPYFNNVAHYFFTRAFEDNFPPALFTAALATSDEMRALFYLEEAVRGDFFPAKYHYAQSLLKGCGTRGFTEEEVMPYIEAAAAQGYPLAVQEIQRIRKKKLNGVAKTFLLTPQSKALKQSQIGKSTITITIGEIGYRINKQPKATLNLASPFPGTWLKAFDESPIRNIESKITPKALPFGKTRYLLLLQTEDVIDRYEIINNQLVINLIEPYSHSDHHSAHFNSCIKAKSCLVKNFTDYFIPRNSRKIVSLELTSLTSGLSPECAGKIFNGLINSTKRSPFHMDIPFIPYDPTKEESQRKEESHRSFFTERSKPLIFSIPEVSQEEKQNFLNITQGEITNNISNRTRSKTRK